MPIKYIINKNAQPTGEHEVHAEMYCNQLPEKENRIFLGNYGNCSNPILDAKKRWPQEKIDGCAYCIPECHSR